MPWVMALIELLLSSKDKLHQLMLALNLINNHGFRPHSQVPVTCPGQGQLIPCVMFLQAVMNILFLRKCLDCHCVIKSRSIVKPNKSTSVQEKDFAVKQPQRSLQIS